MNEREKIKKTIRRGSQERQQKKTAATYEGGKTNKQKETLQIAMAANNAAIRKPDERKKMARKEKIWRCSISMKRDNTSRLQKKTGDGLPPFPLHTRRHDGKRKKWRERLAVRVGAKTPTHK